MSPVYYAYGLHYKTLFHVYMKFHQPDENNFAYSMPVLDQQATSCKKHPCATLDLHAVSGCQIPVDEL